MSRSRVIGLIIAAVIVTFVITAFVTGWARFDPKLMRFDVHIDPGLRFGSQTSTPSTTGKFTDLSTAQNKTVKRLDGIMRGIDNEQTRFSPSGYMLVRDFRIMTDLLAARVGKTPAYPASLIEDNAITYAQAIAALRSLGLEGTPFIEGGDQNAAANRWFIAEMAIKVLDDNNK